MKRFLLLCLTTLFALTTWAYDFEEEGFYYNILDGTSVEVTWGGEEDDSGTDSYVGELTIPSTVSHNGIEYTVTTIGDDAFDSCDDLIGITIPSSVTSINFYAFWYCTNLTKAIIGENVNNIKSNAFQYCTSLTSITSLNPEPPELGGYVFQQVPESCTLYVPVGSKERYASDDDWNKYFKNIEEINDDGSPMEDGSKFEYEGIYYKIISASDQTIEVTYNVYETPTPTYTGNVEIPASINYNGIKYTVIGIGDDAFDYCDFTSISIPGTITYIGDYAFYECSELLDVEIPNSVTSLGMYAFYYCTGLLSVKIGDGLESLNRSTFEGCSSLADLTLGESMSSIGSMVFYGCKSLSTVTLGKSVSDIASRAFYNCSNLQNFIVADDNEYYCAIDGILYSKDVTELKLYPIGAIRTSYEIPETVEIIQNYAASMCVNLTEVIMNDNLQTISSYAFYRCSNIKTLELGNSVEKINDSAFDGCSSIEKVNIPNSVKSLGESAFEDCISLTDLSIEEGLKTIDDYAFYGDYNLTNIYCFNPEPPECGEDVFYSVDKEVCTLYVPVDSRDAYANASEWKKFLNVIEMTPFSIETLDATGISETSATLNGTVTEAYNDPITSKGFVYWSDDPNVVEVIIINDEDVEMSYTLNNLTPETTYTYRAFAITAGGTTYGEDVEFSTLEDTTTGINGIHISLDD